MHCDLVYAADNARFQLPFATLGLSPEQATFLGYPGTTGLEAEYDDTLARSGDGLYRNFFAELFSNVGNLLVDARDARDAGLCFPLDLRRGRGRVNAQAAPA